MTDDEWSDHPRWSTAVDLAEAMVARGEFRALSFQAYSEGFSPVVNLGQQHRQQVIDDQSLYLVASLTKPVVAATVLQFVLEGLFSLNERVCDFLPEWNQNEKRRITIRHLLSHTSGLPDQLPDNAEMRARGASLKDFYEQVVKVPLEFAPGSRALYQSMGFVVLGHLLETLTGQTLTQLVQERIFTPLGMNNSYLGLSESENQDEVLSRVVEVELDSDQQKIKGNWNSSYWQSLGSPWGGMLSTPADMLKFCTSHFFGLETGTPPVNLPLIFAEASSNQLRYFEEMNARDLQFRPWGLGWRLNWKAHRETFGDLLPETVAGHWGATGALMWMDEQTERACVICTSRPTALSSSSIIRLSNAIFAGIDSMY